MNLSDPVSLIGALGIGSFVGQYLIGSQQRRQVRSEVLRHLSDTESARWASASPAAPTFTESMRELETAALIARVPRRAVTHYKVFAYAGSWLSSDDFATSMDDEFAGGIPGELADLIRDAASELSRVVWSPWIGRIGMKRRVEAQRRRAAEFPRFAPTVARAAEYVGAPKSEATTPGR